ncbi:L-seryl-tRNA(Sec) selenium transferase [bacterium CG17_big_fil_post_rev_8_21_14_2_50_64_8]|nr:MAG: L-seryl-tRNA(Sec) selenium transferase [bacterium CG17_big_fil_post_rev_8_21_14_2_50_64_8]PJA75948.1 MAG: L-seryl-tRNA(Sec) selenium transferase [bacterium CG_4_9_14_3_um_filter_65_15]
MNHLQEQLRELPQISVLLADDQVAELARGRRQAWVTRLVQDVVEGIRRELQQECGPVRPRAELTASALSRIRERSQALLRPAWTRVINGTGVVVHTNLGRSLLPPSAVEAAAIVAAANSDLEFDLESGTRGHRGRRVEEKAALLAGAADALVVNNNAAALWLAVRFLASGGPVLLSRGEVVAIGGSFRLHEILAETGCRLVEVGTTNRTSLDDYASALEPGATVLKVHRSNFTMTGFTEEVALGDLAALCGSHGANLVYDAGSGALFPFAELGLPTGETELFEDVAAGPDLVTCSGDKLLGGCQAGIIFGSGERISGLRRHPMRRAFRVDKVTLAALDSVLTAYLAADDRPDLPTLSLLAQSEAELEARATDLLVALQPHAPRKWRGQVVPSQASVGGGSFSSAVVPTRLVLWQGPKEALDACHLALRTGDPALVGRMNQEGLAVDMRTILPHEEPLVVAAFRRAWGKP